MKKSPGVVAVLPRHDRFSPSSFVPISPSRFHQQQEIRFERLACFRSRMRMLLSLAALAILPAQAVDKSGNIVGETWTSAMNPIRIIGNTNVVSADIRDGVVVEVADNCEILVTGVLRAVGTAARPVRFRPINSTVGFGGLRFEQGPAGSELTFVEITGANNSGVTINKSFPIFRNCTFSQNRSGANGGGLRVTLASGELTFVDCSFFRNFAMSSGGGVHALVTGGKISFSGCRFDSNEVGSLEVPGNSYGGGIYVEGDSQFTQTTFVRNKAKTYTIYSRPGFGTYGAGAHTKGRTVFDRCRFGGNVCETNAHYQTPDPSFAIGGGLRHVDGLATLSNCLFHENSVIAYRWPNLEGSAVASSGTVTLLGCTVIGNLGAPALAHSGGIFTVDSSIVFFNNKSGQQLSGTVSCSYSDIENGAVGVGNLFVNPVINPASFALLPGSVCIDAGNPNPSSTGLFSSPGLGSSRWDMGFSGWTFAKIDQSILFGPIADRAYGSAPFTITAESTSGLPVTIAVVSGLATSTGTTVTTRSAGPVVVRATQLGDSEFNAAPPVDRTLNVTKVQLTVTPDNVSRPYGASVNPSFSAKISGFIQGENASVLTGAPLLSSMASRLSPVGNIPIMAEQGTLAAANYTFSFVPGVLSITKAPLILRGDTQTTIEGQPIPPLTFTVTGFVNGDSIGMLDVLPTISTSATSASPPGTYTISLNGGIDDNYSYSLQPGNLTISAALPAIIVPPTRQTASAGGGASFRVDASGTAPLSYQWRRDGVLLAGATGQILSLGNVSVSDSGNYSVAGSNVAGTTVSASAALIVLTPDVPRIQNLSIRGLVGLGRVSIIGLVIGGKGTNGPKDILFRGVGPSLERFNVSYVADPRLDLYRGNTIIFSNDDWGGAAKIVEVTPRVGGFPLSNPFSLDAAGILTLEANSYTAHITGVGNASGVALAEFYDATPRENFAASTTRLVNVSARAFVGSGDGVLIAGMVLSGSEPLQLLIRGVGPTLTSAPFNLSGVLADPKLEIFNSAGAKIAENDNWGGTVALKAAFNNSGAFNYAGDASRDSALVATLPSGAYTVHLSGVNNSTGTGIVEIYEIR